MTTSSLPPLNPSSLPPISSTSTSTIIPKSPLIIPTRSTHRPLPPFTQHYYHPLPTRTNLYSFKPISLPCQVPTKPFTFTEIPLPRDIIIIDEETESDLSYPYAIPTSPKEHILVASFDTGISVFISGYGTGLFENIAIIGPEGYEMVSMDVVVSNAFIGLGMAMVRVSDHESSPKWRIKLFLMPNRDLSDYSVAECLRKLVSSENLCVEVEFSDESVVYGIYFVANGEELSLWIMMNTGIQIMVYDSSQNVFTKDETSALIRMLNARFISPITAFTTTRDCSVVCLASVAGCVDVIDVKRNVVVRSVELFNPVTSVRCLDEGRGDCVVTCGIGWAGVFTGLLKVGNDEEGSRIPDPVVFDGSVVYGSVFCSALSKDGLSLFLGTHGSVLYYERANISDTKWVLKGRNKFDSPVYFIQFRDVDGDAVEEVVVGLARGVCVLRSVKLREVAQSVVEKMRKELEESS